MRYRWAIWIGLSAGLLPSLALAWPTTSTSYQNYHEDFDAGRANTPSASGDYILQNSIGTVWASETSSDAYTFHQGVYFNIYRDLFPPQAVTTMNAVPRSDGNVELTWSQVQDQESGVWGYRVYRSYYYGRDAISTRVVDAPQNTMSAFTDTDDLLSGIQYFYEVRPLDRAFNEQGEGNKRQMIAVTVQPYSITTTAAVSEPGGDIRLTWMPITAPGSTISYKIYRSVSSGARGVTIAASGGEVQTEYLDGKNSLSGGVRYFYVVQAVVDEAETVKGNNQSSAVSDKGGPNAPVVRSETHPVQALPYPNADPVFRWLRSADPGQNLDVSGYYVKIDGDATTGEAVSGPGWRWVTATSQGYQGLSNGTWYFHCRARDVSGNLGAEAVYCVAVQATGTVQGQVTAAVGGTPMAGVTVEAWLNGQRQAAAATAADGAYRMDNLPYGSYVLQCNRFGYKPVTRSGIILNLEASPVTANVSFTSEAVIGRESAAAYPNPAGGNEVRMVYYCDGPAQVTIEIYNAAGNRVAEIQDNKPAGYQYSIWPLQNVARGVYLFRVTMQTADGKKILPPRKFSIIK